DLDEACICLQLFNGRCSAVSHTGPKSAHELEYRIFHGSLVCHTALYALGNKLLGVLLEVAVLASVLHGCNGSHAPVYFVFSSLEQLESSRALVTSCKDASHHTYIGTCGNGLCHVAGVLDTSI